ncbi:Ankyrin repeat-containing protein [Colletotrichum asianum]
MAEIVGIVLGLAPLLVQISSGIDKLRDIRQNVKEAHHEVDFLLSELKFMVCLMQSADDVTYRDDQAHAHCQRSCSRVLQSLERLITRILERPKMGGTSVSKLWIFRRLKEDLVALQREIDSAKINLSLLLQSVQVRHLCLQSPSSEGTESPSSEYPTQTAGPGSNNESLELGPELPESDAPLSNQAIDVANTHQAIKRQKLKYRQDCLSRSCCCQCHHSERASGRFWALDYSLMGIFQTCNVEECNAAKYGVNVRLALTQLGIHRSVVIKVHFLSGLGSFSPSFSLQTDCTVPYTSPGFEVIWRCQNGMIKYEDARSRLIHLYQSDPSFRYHVNPAGKSYIEELVRCPWGGFATRRQLGLLQLLMGDLGMVQGSMHPRFLTRCAKWIGEGPHLHLLETLIGLDFDAGEVEVQAWPEPCFAGMTPLHEAVLFGSPHSVKKWIECSKPDQKNFLGQTPLHLAIYNPENLTALVESGHDVNALDNYGITPLMYAAAADQEDALYILINSHADLDIVDSRENRTFFDYAMARRNWGLIYNLLLVVKQSTTKEVAESWVRAATINAQLSFPKLLYNSPISLGHLLALCEDVNFTYDGVNVKDNCLAHDIITSSELEALVDNGFTMINHVNSLGQHALINAAKHKDAALTSRILELGANVNLEDNQHRTAIGHALRGLHISYFNQTRMTMDVVRVLLAADANVLVRDRCRCPCSPTGCLTATPKEGRRGRFGRGFQFSIWSLEWLILVQQHRGVEVAREVVLSFIREETHKDLDMTHVCCELELDESPLRFIFKSKTSEDDIVEIMDEEQEFTDILNSDIDHRDEEEYEALLNYWFTLLRDSIRKASLKAAKTKPHKRPRRKMHEIDYKNDCFNFNISTGTDQARNPEPTVKSSVCDYVLWMVHEYHHGQPSQLDTFAREAWYSKRVSLLCTLLDIIEIRTGFLTDWVGRMQPLWIDGREDPIDPEPYIKHFLASANTR